MLTSERHWIPAFAGKTPHGSASFLKVHAFLATLLLITIALPTFAQEPAPPDPAAALHKLQNSTDYMTRLQAYRDLRQAGAADAIPEVAKALHDAKESHLARYVLESMPFPKAKAALRDAIAGAPEDVLPGILASLGAIRDGEAVTAIKPLIDSQTPAIAEAATGALGRIASTDSVAVLMEAHTANPARLDVAEGLLAAGQQLTEDSNKKEAAKVFRALRGKENPDFVRVGAYFGLAKAAPKNTPERVLKSIQGKDPLYQNLAREVVAQTTGKAATAQYVAALATLPDEAKVLLMEGLARRGDTSAREGVLAMVERDDTAVKSTAIDALGALGNASDVAMLATMLPADDEKVATAARNSLIRLRGPAVDQRIAQSLSEFDTDVRAQLLELLAVRIAPQSVPQATKYLGDDAEAVRLASLRVLQQQGTVSELKPVIEVMKSNPDGPEAELAARTIGAIATGGGEEALHAVLEALPGAPERVQIALVEALGKIGSNAAFEPVLSMLDGSTEGLQRAALSVIEAWPRQEAAPALLELAKSEDSARHDAGLRGYTRLAKNHPEHDPKNAMMAEAMELARSKEDKWMVLSAYGDVHTGPALDMLESQLDDPEVQKEASMALLKVAEAVSKHGEGGKARAKQSMELLNAKAATDTIRAMAEKLLERLQ